MFKSKIPVSKSEGRWRVTLQTDFDPDAEWRKQYVCYWTLGDECQGVSYTRRTGTNSRASVEQAEFDAIAQAHNEAERIKKIEAERTYREVRF